MPQYTAQLPSGLVVTDSETFSGLVIVGSKRTSGSFSCTAWTATVVVTRKMMRSTSMTSTSGVVLMSDIELSVESPPTLIAMCELSYPFDRHRNRRRQ